MVNLTTLAPDIVAAILDDALPNPVTLFDLAVDPPALWDEQRERLSNPLVALLLSMVLAMRVVGAKVEPNLFFGFDDGKKCNANGDNQQPIQERNRFGREHRLQRW